MPITNSFVTSPMILENTSRKQDDMFCLPAVPVWKFLNKFSDGIFNLEKRLFDSIFCDINGF